MYPTIATYAFLTAVVVPLAFQIALAFGAPWGHLTLGGRFPGKLPFALRIVALMQAGMLLLLTGIVVSKSGWAFAECQEFSQWGIWIVVAVSWLTWILNLVTPSRGERLLWAPLAGVLAVSSVVLART